jgi:hypothetical protein
MHEPDLAVENGMQEWIRWYDGLTENVTKLEEVFKSYSLS